MTTTSVIRLLNPRDHSQPAAYEILHPSSGKRYVGSTSNLYKRIHAHKSRLKAGIHSNRNLQSAYDEDPHFNLSATFTDSRESAIDLEQSLIDEGLVRGDLLNVASDARRSGAGRAAPEHVRVILSECSRKRVEDPVFRAKYSEKMKEVMSAPHIREASRERAAKMMMDPVHKEKMIASLSRPVTVDGVSYPSIKEAASKLGLNRSTLSSRLRRQNKQ